MSLVPVTPPAVEPVTVDEAKRHLRVEHGDDDLVIAALITSARQHVEQWIERALPPQAWDWHICSFPPCRDLVLPLRPLRSVESITYFDTDGEAVTLAPEAYRLFGVGGSAAGGVSAVTGWPATTWRSDAATIRFTAGYDLVGAEDVVAGEVPQTIRQAMLLLLAHWFHVREATNVGNIVTEMPFGVAALLAPYRTFV